ncbi:hypothetical protein MD484_g6489, partial [Candolleomyces efflorescens]
MAGSDVGGDIEHIHPNKPPEEVKQEEEPSPPSRAWILRPYNYLPIIIILGQLVLLFGGWTFYIVTSSRPVSLPESTAVFTKNKPTLATLIVTVFSTLLALTSGYLYARAIRYALRLSLSEPLSLFTIHSAVKIASKSPILNVRKMKWTMAGLISIVALALQTAAWSTLLTPRPILIQTSMTGSELDFSKEEVIRATNEAFNLDTDDGTDLPVAVNTLLLNSGHSAVDGRFGRPSPDDFNGFTFVNGTGGITPANLRLIPSVMGALLNSQTSLTNLTHDLPVSFKLEKEIVSPRGFSTNYTITQQGMTAEVKCEQRALNDTTNPAFRIESPLGSEVAIGIAGDTTMYRQARGRTECGAAGQHNFTYLLNSAPHPFGVPNVLYIASCELPDAPVLQYVLQGSGLYASIPTTVCTLKPQITRVDVHYTQFSTDVFGHLDRIEVLDPSEVMDMPLPPSAQRSLVDDLLRASQLVERNHLGDSVVSFLDDVDGRRELNEILETHLRGSFEVAATIVRTTYTQTNNSLYISGNAIPEQLRTFSSGTYTTETIGWHHQSATAPLALLSPTFVSLFSIVIVLTSVVRARTNHTDKEGSRQRAQLEYFDPGDMLHIMAASSTGAFRDPFPVYHADDTEFLKHAQKVKVRLVPPGESDNKASDPSGSTPRAGSRHSNVTAGQSMPLGLVQTSV